MEKGSHSSEISPSEIISTPEEVEEWLTSSAEDYINVNAAQQSLDSLKKHLPTFVHRFNGYKVELPKKIENDWGDSQADYDEIHAKLTHTFDQAFFQPAYEWKKHWEEVAPDKLDSILVRTASRPKQELVTSLAQDLGVTIHFPPPEATDLESLERKRLSESIFANTSRLQDSPEWTPWHTLRTKTIDYARRQRIEQLTEPILAMDTVVVANNTLYNKPVTSEDARYDLSTFSGEDITVFTGYNFLMITHAGELISSPGGTAIKLPLRKFSREEVDELFSLKDYNYMGVNAGIDASHPRFQTLIRDDKPIRIMPFSFGLTVQLADSISFNPNDHIDQGMPVSKAILPLLEPYFLGVPSHTIRKIFKEAPKMYQEVV